MNGPRSIAKLQPYLVAQHKARNLNLIFFFLSERKLYSWPRPEQHGAEHGPPGADHGPPGAFLGKFSDDDSLGCRSTRAEGTLERHQPLCSMRASRLLLLRGEDIRDTLGLIRDLHISQTAPVAWGRTADDAEAIRQEGDSCLDAGGERRRDEPHRCDSLAE